jgi:hypothetical protein
LLPQKINNVRQLRVGRPKAALFCFLRADTESVD